MKNAPGIHRLYHNLDARGCFWLSSHKRGAIRFAVVVYCGQTDLNSKGETRASTGGANRPADKLREACPVFSIRHHAIV